MRGGIGRNAPRAHTLAVVVRGDTSSPDRPSASTRSSASGTRRRNISAPSSTEHAGDLGNPQLAADHVGRLDDGDVGSVAGEGVRGRETGDTGAHDHNPAHAEAESSPTG